MKKRMAVVFYSGNNPVQTGTAVRFCQDNKTDATDIIVIDQGSEIPYDTYDWAKYCHVIRYESNIGGNAVFHRWMDDDWFANDAYEFLAFLHVDLYIREKDFDKRIFHEFDCYPRIALLGFVGSTEIDERGGRGTGTMLNYLGANYGDAGVGSTAETHGRSLKAIAHAGVLDHCSMIFRKDHLVKLTPQEGNLAPEHFYDRYVCCETLSLGQRIAVLGISCDHISGGVGGGIFDAATLCREFLDRRGVSYAKDDERRVTYVESEKDFFKRWKDNNFYPLRVDPISGELFHEHVDRGGFWQQGWHPRHGRTRVDGR